MRGWEPFFEVTLELSIQHAVQRRDYSHAHHFLSLMKTDLLIRKWTALLKLYTDLDARTDSLSALRWVKESAVAEGAWEIARDCDYHQALATRDAGLIERLYFATPYSKYRERLLATASSFMRVLPSEHAFDLDDTAKRRLDIANARELGSLTSLKAGQSLHRLLCALTTDLYRPLSAKEIYARIYPDEDAPQETILSRVTNVIHRLRAWFEENRIPISVVLQDGRVRLVWRGPYAFILRIKSESRLERNSLQESAQLRALERLWPQAPFTSKEAAGHLGISIRTAIQVLARACENGRLVRMGRGRSTHYKFNVQEIKKAA